MKTKLIQLSLIKQPSAYLPVLMSLAALTLVVGHAVVFGIVHETDEGATAHIWQLLMGLQLPVVAYFIIKWAWSQPKEVFQILVLEVILWLANFAAVYWLT